MVCSIGSGKLAAMARVLAAASFSQIITEEVGNQKLTANYIERKLLEVDEANLLDEEDMHVYDLMPLTDSLKLVCCNACKKPIKESQYAAHAEICKSVRIAEEMVPEMNGRNGRKKRPKKEKNKSAAACAATPCEKQERLDSAEADEKSNSSCVDWGPKKDGSAVSPGMLDYSSNAIPPPAKRSKLLLAEAVDKLGHQKKVTGVAKSSCLDTQEAETCTGHARIKGSPGKREQYLNCVGNHKPAQIQCFGLHLQNQDIPAPIRTKMFYSLRNHRLRSAVKCMYYESFSKEQSDDVHLSVSQRDELEVQYSFPANSHGESMVQIEQGEKQPSSLATSVKKPKKVLSDCSDVYMGKLGHMADMDFQNQDSVNSSFSSQATPLGNTRSSYRPQSFTFAGNSGSALGNMQQPKGSVPVT